MAVKTFKEIRQKKEIPSFQELRSKAIPSFEEIRSISSTEAPAEPGEFPIETKKPAFQREIGIAKQALSYTGKGFGKGLGVIAWPFERIERGIATPLTAAAKARAKRMPPVEPGKKLSFMEQTERLFSGTQDFWGEWKESWPAIKQGLKAFVPWKGMAPPEKTSTFVDFMDEMHKISYGRPAPTWYKNTFGIALSFGVTPTTAGKIARQIREGARLTGIPQKIAAKSLPAWQRAKLIKRAEIGGKIEKAKEIGTGISGKQVKKLARTLTKETGTPISTQAVEYRLGQLVKGGITTKPELAKAVHPAIEAFEANAKTLRQLGILGKETYLTKLPRKRIAGLLKEKAELQRQIRKIKEVPYQKTLLKSVEKLTPDLSKQKRIADKFLNIALKAEEKGKKLSQMGDDFIKTAIEVTTGSPTAKKIATLLDFAPGDKRLTLLGKKILSLEKMERVSRNKAANQILKQAGKINPKVSKYVNQTVNDILKIATQIEDSKIIGKVPLLKKIGSMQRRFPGKTSKIQELQTKIDNITGKIQQSYKTGGQKYLPRMYRSKEEERLARKFVGWSKSRIRAHYAKRREAIPEEVRRIMGEIKEPAYPVTKRLIQQASDIETAKLYEFAAKQPGWASSIWEKGLSKQALPDTKAYGALKGMYVHPKIYSDVTELNRIRSTFEQTYDAAIGSWKLGKVVLNPATHMRNKISNKILLDMSGMGYGEQAKYALKALSHTRRKSEDYKIAQKYFARTTQIKGELLDDILKTTSQAKGSGFEKGLNATKRGVKWITKKPSDLYQHEEFTNKFMKYLQQRDKGKSVIESIEQANKWLFDYGDLATWEKNIARRIIPFYTFPRKALPRVLETMVERPLTLAKYPLAAEAMTRYSLAKLEISEKDWEQIQAVLPDYMDKGSYMLMPYRDDNRDLRFFDWTYILPWGELSQIGETTNVGSILMSNPMVRIPAELATNKSIWSGRKIYDDEIPWGEMSPEYRREQTAKGMKYFWGTIAPSLAPKGLYWDRMIEAATGKPLKTTTGKEKKRLLPETIAHTLLGLRTQPIDVEDQKLYRLWDKGRQIREIQSSMNDIEMRKKTGNITSDEYQQRREIYIKQMEDVIERGKEIIVK